MRISYFLTGGWRTRHPPANYFDRGQARAELFLDRGVARELFRQRGGMYFLTGGGSVRISTRVSNYFLHAWRVRIIS